MAAPDDIRSGLHAAAASIEVGDTDGARADVGGLVHRRQRRRRVIGAFCVVVALGAGAALVSVVDGADDDPRRLVSVDVSASEATDAAAPLDSVAGTAPDRELGGERFAVLPDEQEARWIVPWRDGFLVGSFEEPIEVGDTASLRARFTTDGATWQPVDIVAPPGLAGTGRVASTSDRFVIADYLSGTSETIRVASSTDLIEWTVQDFEVSGPEISRAEFGGSFLSLRDLAVNDSGWTFDVERITTMSDFPGLATGNHQVRSDAEGVTVVVGPADGSSAGSSTTNVFTWAELRIAAGDVPYLTGEIPAFRTWAATWDGQPVETARSVPSGLTLGTAEGFVRWNDHTWFSPDGVEWSRADLPDPDGVVRDAWVVDDGIVAVVQTIDGTSDSYLLDGRGGNPRRLDIEGMPEQFASGFRAFNLGADWFPASSAMLFDPAMVIEPPVIIDIDGYRWIERPTTLSVIDLATGDLVVSIDFFARLPAADTVITFVDDEWVVTDPSTEEVLMRIPAEAEAAARRASADAVERAASSAGSLGLGVLASRDGEQFLVERVQSSNPDPELASSFGVDVVGVATNGDVVLVRLGDEWIRYVMPS